MQNRNENDELRRFHAWRIFILDFECQVEASNFRKSSTYTISYMISTSLGEYQNSESNTSKLISIYKLLDIAKWILFINFWIRFLVNTLFPFIILSVLNYKIIFVIKQREAFLRTVSSRQVKIFCQKTNQYFLKTL